MLETSVLLLGSCLPECCCLFWAVCLADPDCWAWPQPCCTALALGGDPGVCLALAAAPELTSPLSGAVGWCPLAARALPLPPLALLFPHTKNSDCGNSGKFCDGNELFISLYFWDVENVLEMCSFPFPRNDFYNIGFISQSFWSRFVYKPAVSTAGPTSFYHPSLC